MSCAACSARVEKAVSAVPGVYSVEVNLLAGTMRTQGNASPDDIISAVRAAGYGAKEENNATFDSSVDKTNETRLLLRKLICSLAVLLLLMYVSMGHIMLGFPLPVFLSGNIVSIALAELILSTVVLFINRAFFVNGWNGIVNKAPNMDTLVATGSGASYLYSIATLFLMNTTAMKHGFEAAVSFSNDLFFESAAMIPVLITLGKTLESQSKGKTTNALKELLALAPDTAVIETAEGEITVHSRDLQVGAVFILKPGSSIPADGLILEGSTSVDESSITGESIPVNKSPGDKVTAGTINCDGRIRCVAEKVGSDTSLAKIVEMVSDAAAGKAPISRLADKVAGIFVPVVVILASLTIVIWLLIGQEFGFALARGISVLVISCPCALGLATPVAVMVGSGMGAKKGILFKTAAALEMAGRIENMSFDKTGTVTEGVPVVKEIYSSGQFSSRMLLTYAASVEVFSEHPLAKAIVERATCERITFLDCNGFIAEPGMGASGIVGSKTVCGGNERYIRTRLNNPDALLHGETGIVISGRTPIYFSVNGEYAGLITVSDKIRPDAQAAISQLEKMGIQTVMITGDSEENADIVKSLCGIDKAFSRVLPGDKASIVNTLSLNGRTAMVGDGINDAPALCSADLGMAIGAGTDIAIGSADVVLVNSRISDAVAAIRLGRLTLRTIKQNLFWAFFYNCIGIPVAAGVFINSLGIKLNPMIAAACMSLSSLFVVTNALRLGTKDIYSSKYDRKNRIKRKKEFDLMTKTIKVEGMMCMHCEARVRDTLKAIDGVITAAVDFRTGNAIVTCGKDIPDDVFITEIEKQGYKTLSIE